jgi:hypothetical protein
VAGARAALARTGEGLVTALLALVERIRAVELRLARARAAAEQLGPHTHALGNAIQIVELASLELARTAGVPLSPPLVEVRTASSRATDAFSALLSATTRPLRTALGPPVAPVVRATVELVRPAIGAALELRAELIDAAQSRLRAEELEAIVLACTLDVAAAPRITLILRERIIENRRWIELVRIDPGGGHDLALELELEPPSWLGVVDQLAREVGGELSLSAGRSGRELVVAWPVAS